MNHVRYRSKACHLATLMAGPLQTPEETKIIIDAQKPAHRASYAAGKKRHYKDAPRFRLCGPLPLSFYFRFGNLFSERSSYRDKHGIRVYNMLLAGLICSDWHCSLGYMFPSGFRPRFSQRKSPVH